MQSRHSKPARILLLSGYDAKSHQYWRNSLRTELDEYHWTQIALADRHFWWRLRGNSMTFAFQHQQALAEAYDALIVTSMVDLASLRGFAPHLAKLPTLVYVHENQFDYPQSQHKNRQDNLLNAQLTSIYSLLCADRVLFNSLYNKNSFFDGAKALFRKLPDGVAKELLSQIEPLCQVVPVAIDDDCWQISKTATAKEATNKKRGIEIVWNHRWEYDKQPEVLFDALKLLKEAGISFKLHILGQSFRKIPDCFAAAKEYFSDEILTWGYQPLKQYRQILTQADVVVSTALHDFQGLSMLEAIASGCSPIAPDRVAYPEYIPAKNLYSVTDNGNEAVSLFRALKDTVQAIESRQLTRRHREDLAQRIKRYSQQDVVPDYRRIIEQLIALKK